MDIKANNHLNNNSGNGVKDACLIVEDEPAIQRLIVATLRGICKNHVLAAGSAEEALELLTGGNGLPSVVITDVKLPGMSGVELTHKIKDDPRFEGLPVLVMTAYGEPKGHGGDGFLAKPFDPDEFEDFVAPFLTDRRH